MTKAYFFGIATIALLGCGSDDPTGTDDPPDANTVLVRNNQFSPTPLTVAVNETVTFQWNSAGTVHNVTFDDGPASPNQGAGSFPRTFAAAGSFPYRCTLHPPGMTGVVNVTASTDGSGSGGGTDDTGDGGGGGYP